MENSLSFVSFPSLFFLSFPLLSILLSPLPTPTILGTQSSGLSLTYWAYRCPLPCLVMYSLINISIDSDLSLFYGL